MVSLRLLLVVVVMYLHTTRVEPYDIIPKWVFGNHSETRSNPSTTPQPTEEKITANIGTFLFYERIPTTNICVRIHTAIKTWENARLICEKEGSKLAFPHSEEEAEMYNDYLSRSFLSGFRMNFGVWMGMKRDHTDEPWTTVEGYQLSNTEIKSWNIQNDISGSYRCLIFYFNSLIWSVTECTSTALFLCAKEC